MANSAESVWSKLPEALSNEETCALIREGSKESLEKALIGNLRLVRAVVSRHISNLQNGDFAVASLEDMEQDCVFALMKCVKSFDPDRGVSFSAFASKSIMNVLGMEYRRQKKSVKPISLETKIFGTKKKDDEGTSIFDTVPDPQFEADNQDNLLEKIYLKTNIFPILSRKERDIFIDYYYHDLTKSEIAIKQNVVRTIVSRYLERAKNKVQKMLREGISSDDLAIRKISLNEEALLEFKEKRGIIKKYGEEFLRRRFLLKLTLEQATIFKNAFLNYCGQSKKMLPLGTSLKEKDFEKGCEEIKQILKEKEKELLAEKAEFDKLPIIKVQSKEVKATNALIERYGGRAFLWKYFVPILKSEEKQVFAARVLNFDGSLTNGEIAKALKLDVATLKRKTLQVTKKLEKIDLELLNELVDNAKGHNFGFDINFEKVKERKLFVQKFGNKFDILKSFAPTLKDDERQMFKDFYIFPQYKREEDFAKAKGWSKEQFDTKEKEIREKLQNFNFGESAKQPDCSKAKQNEEKSKNI